MGTRYKDKKGRWSKLDKRKLLRPYQYDSKSKRYVSLAKAFTLGRNIGSIEFVKWDIEKISRQISELPSRSKAKGPKRLTHSISLTKDSNQDLFTFLGHKQINKLVKKIRRKGKVLIAQIEVKIDGQIYLSQFTKVTHFKQVFISGKRGKRGLRYTAKDKIAVAIHETINENHYSPYHQNASGGMPKTSKQMVGNYEWLRKQHYKINFYSVSPKSRRVKKAN